MVRTDIAIAIAGSNRRCCYVPRTSVAALASWAAVAKCFSTATERVPGRRFRILTKFVAAVWGADADTGVALRARFWWTQGRSRKSLSKRTGRPSSHVGVCVPGASGWCLPFLWANALENRPFKHRDEDAGEAKNRTN